MLKQLDSAEMCIKKSLEFAYQSQSHEAKQKALNNYAVYYRLQGNYDRAINCLRLIASEPTLTNSEETLLYLNLGKTFSAFGITDSATFYYKHMGNSK